MKGVAVGVGGSVGDRSAASGFVDGVGVDAVYVVSGIELGTGEVCGAASVEHDTNKKVMAAPKGKPRTRFRRVVAVPIG